MGQCSVMGCGWDWLADILAQYCLAVWCISMSTSRPFKLFTVLFTAVEISTGLFDFATSCLGFYPTQSDTSHGPWYAYVEHWLTPNQTYSDLGVWCWLANTLYPLAVCLQAPFFVSAWLFPFAMLYAWHEVSQFLFVIANWKEVFIVARVDADGKEPTSVITNSGIDYVRRCDQAEIDVLTEAYTLVKDCLWPEGDTHSAKSKPRLAWVNIFNNNKPCPAWDNQPEPVKKRFQDFIDKLLTEDYHGKPPMALSYGFINNPINCAKNQTWHMDYGDDVSNLFISMTDVRLENATQYIRGPIKARCTTSNYFPEPTELMDDEGVDHLEVCQLVCKPYTLFKLYPGVVHRGIANKAEYDRVVFFVSTNPTFIDIEEEGELVGDLKEEKEEAGDKEYAKLLKAEEEAREKSKTAAVKTN
jgi:hypothetical protein